MRLDFFDSLKQYTLPFAAVQAGLLDVPWENRVELGSSREINRIDQSYRKPSNKEVYHTGWNCSAGKETTGTADERGMWSQEWPGEHDKNVSLTEQELGSLYVRLSVRFKAKHTQHKTTFDSYCHRMWWRPKVEMGSKIN